MELKEYERAVQRSALLVRDKEINDYVRTAACRVAGDYCTDMRIYVIRNPYFNASMTANGVMEIWTGLLVRVSSEDELAAVLGHELAHYTQLHTVERLRRITKNLASGSVFDLGLAVLTGVSVPVGRLSAVANMMAFSRDQEEEADLLGAEFMASAGYDPNAAVHVWEMIVEEEASAIAKKREPDFFAKTHPSATDRIVALKAFVGDSYGATSAGETSQRRHVEILNRYYMLLMEDQLDTNRFGRTQAILQRHQEIGVDETLLNFFQGEMYRQRNESGDTELAKAAYHRSIEGQKPLADAHRNLGYLYLKEKNLPEARHHFGRYLELKPDADDRAMIEFYLQEP